MKENAQTRTGLFASPVACYVIILFVALVFYAIFTQRSVVWQDSGEYQWRVLANNWISSQGLVRSHPLYIAAGRGILWLVGKSNLIYALNLFSGIGMAVAVANCFLLGNMLTEKKWIAILGAAILAVCHTPWWLAEVTEVYTWSLAIFLGELCVLVLLMRKPSTVKLYFLALLAGMSLAVHGFALLSYPVYFVVAVVLAVKKKIPLWSLVAALAFWCAGASLWLGQLAWLWERTSFMYAVKNSLVGMCGTMKLSHKLMKVNICIATLNFANFLLPFAFVGWWKFRRRLGGGLAAALIAITVIQIAFFIHHPVPDKFMFILPTLGVITLAAMVGMNVLASHSTAWKKAVITLGVISVLLGPACYWSLPHLLRGRVAELSKPRWPYRDEATYWICPWKQNENSAEMYCMETLLSFQKNEKIDLSGRGTELFPMLAIQEAYNVRPDVTLQSSSLPGGAMWRRNYSPQQQP